MHRFSRSPVPATIARLTAALVSGAGHVLAAASSGPNAAAAPASVQGLATLAESWYQSPATASWLVLLNLVVCAGLLARWWTMRRALANRSARLDQTQRLLDRTSRSALVGGWEYDVARDELTWTPHVHLINGSSSQTFKPSVEHCLATLCDAQSATLIRQAFLQCRSTGTSFDQVFQLNCANGGSVWASLAGEAEIQGGKVVRIVGSLRNIDELKRQQFELERSERHFRQLALHDPLTGLNNRLGLSERLDELTGTGSLPDGRLALCILDADNFKAINDMLGHAVGDSVIRTSAGRLLAAVDSRHFVGRIGGDEFVVLLSSPQAAEEATVVAKAMMATFVEPIETTGGPVRLTASVGIALFPDDAASGEELLSAACTALRAAKTSGRNVWRRYTVDMGRATAARARALQDVRGAHDRGELELFYQPKIDLVDGHAAGVEALLRWRTANGFRAPAELIAAAEESGFIRTLGSWVLESAARQAGAWADRGIACPIAVNVSLRQLHDREFVGHLAQLVQRDPRLAGLLELEITETALATDTDTVLQLLGEIRTLGVKVHIDDFGTGYSSLSYLGRLPVDSLKIDRSLVAATTGARDAREIVSAIIALAGSLGLETVAEGVETAAQAAFLRRSGCSQAQGYLFARPMPAADAAWFWRARRKRNTGAVRPASSRAPGAIAALHP
jgi:diguanylate cyclase (GGDEF)-like protein